jgi:tRNA-dihydrouridine synthase
VSVPVIVNGDVKTAHDAKRALEETGCAGVMVGRAAIEHPWIFREARALLDRGELIAPPTTAERFELLRRHYTANCTLRGPRYGVLVTRRHVAGYLKGLPGAVALRKALFEIESLAGCVDMLHAAEENLAASGSCAIESFRAAS